MKIYSVAILLLFLSQCKSKDSTVSIGKIVTIDSKILGEKRTVWIHSPYNLNRSHATTETFPVAYLLDGGAHFSSVMGMIQQLSEVNGNTLIPNMILVGILNTDRERDLTPTHAATDYRGDSAAVKTSGGGERFVAFIEKELIPYVDSAYPTAPYRVLIGHSLGGLTVINTLVHHPGLFNSYLAIDPSMWWDHQQLLRQTETALAQDRFAGKTLYLAIANTMTPGMDTAHVRKDTTGMTLHIRSILQLADALKRNSNNGLRWTYKYYDNDSHGTVPLIAEYDAFRFIFSAYYFPLPAKIFDTSMNGAAAVAILHEHYQGISQQIGYTVLPPYDYINSMGYFCLQLKMTDKARALFQLNIDSYPQNGDVFDSMGDYYATVGDKPKAIDFYTKAFALNHDPGTKKKLDKLRQ
ncbi:MAG TPA: alpha/beta hydrolase-fold protein [Puia sp.]|nr:alpha/beta hydrolase-fold protein [Puia sp.]